jgi:hypothetical protein
MRISYCTLQEILGEITPSYILHTRAFGTYLLGVTYLAKRLYGDGILHVNMFHYFKIPYFTCTFFSKFTYNEYIGPYFLSHVVLRFSPVNSPRRDPLNLCCLKLEAVTKTCKSGYSSSSSSSNTENNCNSTR